MLESVLFKDVDMVLPNGRHRGDVYVSNGRIQEISPSISRSAEYVLNESGLTLLPGCIDPHVHFRDPGVTHKEDIYSGSKAAVSGGVTSFFDMPNTNPSTISCEAMAAKKAHASQVSLANYNFYIGATQDNLEELQKVENVPGIKIYVGSSTGTLLVDELSLLRSIFEGTDHLIAVHSEDEAMIRENMEKYAGSDQVMDHMYIRSAEGALVCTERLVKLALDTNTRLHICHLTTVEEVEFLRGYVDNPLISTEVTSQHLLTYAPDVYEKWGTFAQINPPIREKRHQEGLWKGLLEGTIPCMGSDHAPHLIEEKEQPFGKAPSGMPGVETSLPLMLNLVDKGLVTLEQVVRWLSAAPAELFSIENKGLIKEGYDADLVLVDLNQKKTISKETTVSRCGWSIYEGQTLAGVPVATFVNGQMVYREGDFFEDIKGKEVSFSRTVSAV